MITLEMKRQCLKTPWEFSRKFGIFAMSFKHEDLSLGFAIRHWRFFAMRRLTLALWVTMLHKKKSMKTNKHVLFDKNCIQ